MREQKIIRQFYQFIVKSINYFSNSLQKHFSIVVMSLFFRNRRLFMRALKYNLKYLFKIICKYTKYNTYFITLPLQTGKKKLPNTASTTNKVDPICKKKMFRKRKQNIKGLAVPRSFTRVNLRQKRTKIFLRHITVQLGDTGVWRDTARRGALLHLILHYLSNNAFKLNDI